ncbi:MAG TPA: NAD(P)H-dependent oxidoreductase [Polyangiales bacterium]|jgi:NAD(P)H-dependent FMN reductase|nr:NAD(P)H-dependent oxidoreductase [Polyangiales bacterium]
MPKLNVIICSTRPGRVGLPIGQWFFERAKQHGKLEVELVDLKEMALPIFDEPKHPRFQQYEHEHTKRWSASVSSADAFVFVTPEYNFSSPPALVNAIDYLFREWQNKPAGLVSYGGVSGGLRSAQMTKLLLTAVKVMPLPEAVTIPSVGSLVENGTFKGGDNFDKAATGLLDELLRWANALKVLRE